MAGTSTSYKDGEYIVREGERGDCMYFVEAGEVEVVRRHGGQETYLAVLAAGDFFGEMALIEHDIRSASVRALGEAKVVALDEESFLQRIGQDPSLAFRLFDRMSERLRDLTERLRAMGDFVTDSARPASLEKKEFLATAQKSPKQALRTLETMSACIREMNDRLENMTSLQLEQVR